MADQSNLRNKLATRAAGQMVRSPEGEPMPLVRLINDTIQRQSAAFKAVLPAHVDTERFARLVLVAIKGNPKLKLAFTTDQGQTSVLLSVMQAAALGLEPNTPTQECWLIPRRGRNAQNEWVDECELQIGYLGYKKLARRTGNVKTIFAEVVRANDHFRWSRGLEEDVLEHTAADDDADLSHAYAVVRYKEGGADFIVMNRTQVEKRRAMSDSWKRDQKYPEQEPRSPWNNWTPEQWKKTALRTLCKGLDLDPAVSQADALDERTLELREGSIAAAADTALPPATQRELEQATDEDPPVWADAEVAPSGPPEGVDAETGEVASTISEPQKKALFAYLKTANIEERADRLTWASATLGREVKTYNDLTVAEASTLIDTAANLVRAMPADPPTDDPGQ